VGVEGGGGLRIVIYSITSVSVVVLDDIWFMNMCFSDIVRTIGMKQLSNRIEGIKVKKFNNLL